MADLYNYLFSLEAARYNTYLLVDLETTKLSISTDYFHYPGSELDGFVCLGSERRFLLEMSSRQDVFEDVFASVENYFEGELLDILSEGVYSTYPRWVKNAFEEVVSREFEKVREKEVQQLFEKMILPIVKGSSMPDEGKSLFESSFFVYPQKRNNP